MNYASEMASTIDRFCSPKGLSHNDYFVKFLDDTLYNFGKPVEKNHIPDDGTYQYLINMSSIYVKALNEHPYQDILGDVYQELSGKYKRSGLGQFFTPSHVCELMAMMVHAYKIESIKDEFFEICEPCIGAGGMILAFMKLVKRSNPGALSRIAVYGIDLDIMCCKMATTQIVSNLFIQKDSLASIIIQQGNTLGDPGDWNLFYGLESKEYSEYRRNKPDPIKPININPTASFEQLDLF
jgi:type I restriction-modification system DNA methylase subunit